MSETLTLSVAEVAAALGQSDDAIYAAIGRGEIPDVGVGARRRIPKAWLDARFAAAVPTEPDRTFSFT